MTTGIVKALPFDRALRPSGRRYIVLCNGSMVWDTWSAWQSLHEIDISYHMEQGERCLKAKSLFFFFFFFFLLEGCNL